MGDEYERHLNINLKNAANNLDYSEIFDKNAFEILQFGTLPAVTLLCYYLLYDRLMIKDG